MGLGKLTKTIILIASTTFLLSTVTAQPALDLFGDLEMNDNDLVADGLTVWDGQNQELTDEALGELDSTNIDETGNYDWTGTHTYEGVEVSEGIIGFSGTASGIQLDGDNSFIQFDNSESTSYNPHLYFGDFSGQETAYEVVRDTDGLFKIKGTGSGSHETVIDTPMTTKQDVFFEGRTDYDGRVRIESNTNLGFGTNDEYKLRYESGSEGFLLESDEHGEIFGIDDSGNTLHVNELSLGTSITGDQIGEDQVSELQIDQTVSPTWENQHDFNSGIETNGDITSNSNTVWNSVDNYVPTSSLESSSIDINTGNALSGGGTVNLGDSTTLDVEANSIGNNELDNNADITVSSVTATDLVELEQNTQFTCETGDIGQIFRDGTNNLQYCNDGSLEQLN